jgi:putative endonuclease
MQDEEGPSRARGRKLEKAPPLPGSRKASTGSAPTPRSRPVRSSSRRPTGRRTAKQLVGIAAESIAAEFLRAQGLEILQRNYLRRLGELDIVARDPGGVLVIAEVRARSSERFGGAAASVGFRKQQRLVRAASQLLQQRSELSRLPVRFDVLCVSGVGSERPRVEWIRQAFLT